MSELNIVVQEPFAAATEPQNGDIKIGQQAGSFSVSSATNHNEIRILENDWNEICNKVNAIKTSNQKEWIFLLYGVAIPLMIDIVKNWAECNRVSIICLIICLSLIIFLQGKSLRFQIWGKTIEITSDADSKVHLEDLKNITKRISNEILNKRGAHVDN